MPNLSYDKRALFEFMLDAVKEKQRKGRTAYALEDAFPLWFVDIYFQDAIQPLVANGQKDAKIDVLFATKNGNALRQHVVNAKFTEEFNKAAPVRFYEELTYFWRTFESKHGRDRYLSEYITPEMRPRYRELYDGYDRGLVDLLFVTNHRRNDSHYDQVKDLPVTVFHLDDLIQYLIDDLDVAMPRTPPLCLTDIHSILSPDKRDCEVPTSIVFARLVDFIRYMQSDPYDLLFARNVRLDLGNTEPNKEIKRTFREHPREFAFSNNGITMLCEGHTHNPGTTELTLVNPRVVNGSQTLHSIRDVPSPSPNARVMVRIVEIGPVTGSDIEARVAKKKEIINKIAVRSNLQNPIKRWDLVANDDFQLDLYRYFRRKGYFYERRTKEWNSRSKHLKAVGIDRGPDIKWLMQLTASYHWDHPKLGPGVARQSVSKLFERRREDQALDEGKIYDLLSQTEPELAYQIFLTAEMVKDSLHYLQGKRKRTLAKYAWMTMFALVVKSFQGVGRLWKAPEFTDALERQWDDDGLWESCCKHWDALVKATIDFVHPIYRKEAAGYLKKEGEELTLANFFKNVGYVNKLMQRPLPAALRSNARTILLAAKAK